MRAEYSSGRQKRVALLVIHGRLMTSESVTTTKQGGSAMPSSRKRSTIKENKG